MTQISEAPFVYVSQIGINNYSEAQPESSQKIERQLHNHIGCEDLYNNVIQQNKERYRFLPYWSTSVEERSKSPVPVIKPIYSEETQVTEANEMHQQERFMVGDSLLVVPSMKQQVLKGLEGRWYDYYTKREIFANDEIKTALERIGCFVKGGNIIPTFDIRSYVESTKEAKESNINLYIALDNEEKSRGKLYFADEETAESAFSRKVFDFQNNILTWKGEEETHGYSINNRVTRAILMGLSSKVQQAYLVQEGKPRHKIQLIKNEGYVVLEFVALASRNWKIVLE